MQSLRPTPDLLNQHLHFNILKNRFRHLTPVLIILYIWGEVFLVSSYMMLILMLCWSMHYTLRTTALVYGGWREQDIGCRHASYFIQDSNRRWSRLEPAGRDYQLVPPWRASNIISSYTWAGLVHYFSNFWIRCISQGFSRETDPIGCVCMCVYIHLEKDRERQSL